MKLLILILTLYSSIAYSKITILENDDYTAYYSSDLNTTLLTREILLVEEYTANIPRYKSFLRDPRVPTNTLPLYIRSGYDRGHIAASANFATVNSIRTANLQSNITPQYPLFNRGIWKALETRVRKYSSVANITVYTGLIFNDCTITNSLNNTVPIADSFFKVIFNDNGDYEAYLIPHSPITKGKLDDYRATLELVNRVNCITDIYPPTPKINP